MVEDVLPPSLLQRRILKIMKRTRCLDGAVPNVAGRSCQWIEAEGRGSAAGTQSICLLFILLDG